MIVVLLRKRLNGIFNLVLKSEPWLTQSEGAQLSLALQVLDLLGGVIGAETCARGGSTTFAADK